MNVIVLLIVAGGVVAVGFLAAFVWAVRSGQYDDTLTPAVRMLLDERTAAAPGPGAAHGTDAIRHGRLEARGPGTEEGESRG